MKTLKIFFIFVLLAGVVHNSGFAQNLIRGLFGIAPPVDITSNSNEQQLIDNTHTDYLFGMIDRVNNRQDQIMTFCRDSMSGIIRMNVEHDMLYPNYHVWGPEHNYLTSQIWAYISRSFENRINHAELDRFITNTQTHYAPDYSAMATILVAHQGLSGDSTHWPHIEYICNRIQTTFGDSVRSVMIHEVDDNVHNLRPADLPAFVAAVPHLDIFMYERYPFSTWSPNPQPPALAYVGDTLQTALQTVIDGYTHCQVAFEAPADSTDWHAIIQVCEQYVHDGTYYVYHRRPTEAEIFAQANLALSRGAKGIHVYVYASNGTTIDFNSQALQHLGLVTQVQPRTTLLPTYNHAAALFNHLDQIGPELATKRCLNAFNCGNIPGGLYITGVTGDILDGARRTIEIGLFEDPAHPTLDYFMLVNRRCSIDAAGNPGNPQVITLQTNRNGAAYRIQDLVTGETYISGNGTFPNIDIAAGRARLFEMCPVFTTNETWNDSIHVYCDVTLPANRELTIQPNTVVLFAPLTDNLHLGRDNSRAELTILGRLSADNARFTSVPVRENWYGIVLDAAHTDSYIRNCIIEFGCTGVLCLNLNTTNVVLEGNTLRETGWQAVWIDHSDLNVIHNLIEDNARYGIYVANSTPYIDNNLIQDNTAHYGIYCNHSTYGYIRNNTIQHCIGGVRCANGASPYLVGRSVNEAGGYNIIRNNSWWGVCPSETSHPNLGIEFDDGEFDAGLNCIYGNGSWQVKNLTNATVYARNNYWQTIPPGFYGSVVYVPYLPTPPRPLSKGQMLALNNLNRATDDEKMMLEYLKKGQLAESAGDFENAGRAFRWVIENYPEHELAVYALSRLVACRDQQDQTAAELNFIFELAEKFSGTTLGQQALYWEPFLLAKAKQFEAAIKRSNQLMTEKANTEMEKDLLFQQIMLYYYELNDVNSASQSRDQFLNQFSADQRSFELRSLDFLFKTKPVFNRPVTAGINEISDGFTLAQNYPNPFNTATQIFYQLDQPAYITLKIFNLLGQEILTLAEQNHAPGSYTIRWNGKDINGLSVPAGIYIVRIAVVNQPERQPLLSHRKLVLLY